MVVMMIQAIMLVRMVMMVLMVMMMALVMLVMKRKLVLTLVKMHVGRSCQGMEMQYVAWEPAFWLKANALP